jgi:threonine dehydrogenase-like Zn-dependent dehydrogenase
MRAAFLTEQQTLEIRDVELRSDPIGHVDVRVLGCGVCGSDLHGWRHPELNITGAGEPIAGFSGHEIAVAYDDADTGTEQVATIEPNRLTACGECESCVDGAAWFCRNRTGTGTFGYAERMRVPVWSLFPVLREVAPLATLVEPLACAVHTIRFSSTAGAPARIDGRNVAVIGAGVTGLMTVAAAKHLGAAAVAISARHPHQREAAERLGADVVFDAGADDTERALRRFGPELVVECVGGTAPTLPLATRVARSRGEVAVFGVFDEPQLLDVRRASFKELRFFFPITYAVRNGIHDYDIAIEMITAAPERYRALITHRFPLEEIQTAFGTAADKSSGAIRVVVEP